MQLMNDLLHNQAMKSITRWRMTCIGHCLNAGQHLGAAELLQETVEKRETPSKDKS
jgi:hypothetical protein